MSFVLLAVLLPQPSEAHRRTELKGFRVLLVSNLDGGEKAGFRFALRVGKQGTGRGSIVDFFPFPLAF